VLCKEMSCEICGRKIGARANKVIVEGLNLMVCNKCSDIGERGWKVALEKVGDSRAFKSKISSIKVRKPSARAPAALISLENYEVVENFSENIKKGRERMGISQEEFAKIIKEKLSVVQKIESGKIVPSIKLSREIEHALKIKLLTNQKEEKESDLQSDAQSALTIGDILQFKKKEKAQK